MLNIWRNAQGKDGLRSLQYRVEALELREGYTWLLVSVDEDAVLKVLYYHVDGANDDDDDNVDQ